MAQSRLEQWQPIQVSVIAFGEVRPTCLCVCIDRSPSIRFMMRLLAAYITNCWCLPGYGPMAEARSQSGVRGEADRHSSAQIFKEKASGNLPWQEWGK